MNRLALIAVLALSFSSCIIVPRHGPHGYAPPVHAVKCPPGHVWSDGRCHAHGRGHDPHHGGYRPH